MYKNIKFNIDLILLCNLSFIFFTIILCYDLDAKILMCNLYILYDNKPSRKEEEESGFDEESWKKKRSYKKNMYNNSFNITGSVSWKKNL